MTAVASKDHPLQQKSFGTPAITRVWFKALWGQFDLVYKIIYIHAMLEYEWNEDKRLAT
jgi:hypothetical protein